MVIGQNPKFFSITTLLPPFHFLQNKKSRKCWCQLLSFDIVVAVRFSGGFSDKSYPIPIEVSRFSAACDPRSNNSVDTTGYSNDQPIYVPNSYVARRCSSGANFTDQSGNFGSSSIECFGPDRHLVIAPATSPTTSATPTSSPELIYATNFELVITCTNIAPAFMYYVRHTS